LLLLWRICVVVQLSILTLFLLVPHISISQELQIIVQIINYEEKNYKHKAKSLINHQFLKKDVNRYVPLQLHIFLGIGNRIFPDIFSLFFNKQQLNTMITQVKGVSVTCDSAQYHTMNDKELSALLKVFTGQISLEYCIPCIKTKINSLLPACFSKISLTR
jgi:hypothetical protein